jgi:hypothetical protein
LASPVLREALAREPGSLDIPVSLGFALLHEGQDRAAAFFLRAALRRDPRDAAARLLLSWALRRASLEEAAEDEWRDLSAQTDAFTGLREPELSRRFERVLTSERAVVVEPGGRADAERALSHVARAEQLTHAGDLAGATTELLTATALLPFDPGGTFCGPRPADAASGQGREEPQFAVLPRGRYVEPATCLSPRPAARRGPRARASSADPGNASARKLVEDRP